MIVSCDDRKINLNRKNEIKIKILLWQKTVSLGQNVQRIVGLAHTSDLTADGIGSVGASHDASSWVDINKVQLNRSVIASADDSVASRASKDRTFVMKR
jgi:hypothetical protein